MTRKETVSETVRRELFDQFKADGEFENGIKLLNDSLFSRDTTLTQMEKAELFIKLCEVVEPPRKKWNILSYFKRKLLCH